MDGYELPTCTVFTTGLIACDPLPRCVDGYYGTPTLGDVACVAHGEELTVSGCTACTAVANSDGVVTCSGAGDSQVTGCAAGYHEVDGIPDTCEPNVCINPVSDVDGYELPTCTAFATGTIACDPLPTCSPGYFGTPTIDHVTCLSQDSVSYTHLTLPTTPYV